MNLRALLLAVALVCGGLAVTGAVGETRADAGTIFGSPDLTSVIVVGHDQALVAVGYVGWGGAWTPATNGTGIYAGQILLTVVNLQPYNQSFTFDTWVQGHGWVNQSAPLPAGFTNFQTISVQFPSDPNWEQAAIYMDGTPYGLTIATPISLLPNTIANVGGLDILGLGIISEVILVVAITTAIGAALMRRGIYAPKFSLTIWGHVILIGLLGAVILDYEQVDRTFAGWSPLIYAFAVAPLWLASVLSYFNRSNKAEILQDLVRPGLGVGYRRWLLRVAGLTDGRLILVKEGWAAFWARVWGHYVVIDDGQPDHPAPFKAWIQRVKSPTETRAKDDNSKGRYGRTASVDDWRVLNPQDDGVTLILRTDTSEPVVVTWPKLTIHRTVTVPPKLSPEGNVLRPEHTRRRLSLPHYTEGSVGALRLADEHYQYVAAAAARRSALRDLARVLSKSLTSYYALDAAFEAKVHDRVEALLVTRHSLVNRPSTDLTNEEADAEAIRARDTRSLAELMDWKELPDMAPSRRKGAPP